MVSFVEWIIYSNYYVDSIWSEYVVLHKMQPILPVPDVVPDEFAAQFFVNPITAQVMLLGNYDNYFIEHIIRLEIINLDNFLEVLNPKHGEWVIQSAAGSTLGRMAIQIAK